MTTIDPNSTRVRGTEPAPATPPKRPPVALIVLGTVVLIGAIAGWRRIVFNQTHVTTDNAQIDGHLTTIAPRVQAFVRQVLVDDHQVVRAGDTLVVLEDRDFRARLAQAEADLATARATLGTRQLTGQVQAQRTVSEASAEGAQASVQAAEATYRKAVADLERYRKLAADRIISAQQLDQAQWAVDNAKATLDGARKQATAATGLTVVADAGVRVAEARYAAALAAVDNAKVTLANTVVTAPNAGTIAKRTVEPGSLVLPGQGLMVVVPDDRLWITANLKETQLEDVRTGNLVEFSVDAYPGLTFHGKVESVSPATGARFALLPPDNATGNFTKVVQRVPVRIQIDPKQDPAHPLRPGMSVDVTITTK